MARTRPVGADAIGGEERGDAGAGGDIEHRLAGLRVDERDDALRAAAEDGHPVAVVVLDGEVPAVALDAAMQFRFHDATPLRAR